MENCYGVNTQIKVNLKLNNNEEEFPKKTF